jgi:hypothetical protein
MYHHDNDCTTRELTTSEPKIRKLSRSSFWRGSQESVIPLPFRIKLSFIVLLNYDSPVSVFDDLRSERISE